MMRRMMPKRWTWALILVVAVVCFTQEAEGLRRVLRGHRIHTRQSFTGPPIPGWALVLLVGITELLFGVLLYGIAHKLVISPAPPQQSNSYAPIPANMP